MKRPQDLAQVAPEMLSGLRAGDALRERVLSARPSSPRETLLRAVPLCAAALAVVCVVGLLLSAPKHPDAPAGTVSIESRSAGEAGAESPAHLALLDVPDGSIQITNQSKASAFKSLFASGSGGNFPLVGYNGNAYRMLSSPSALGDGALGEALGSVALYTDEPALADSGAWYGLLSNVAEEGATVYAVSGLSPSTAVAARVSGKARLFQRASYADYGAGGGSLEKVLDVRGKVASLDLSGVGRIEDPGAANALMSVLLDSASFQGDGLPGGKQTLHIKLNSGLTLQLQVSRNTFSGCGSWSCQEFLDAYAQTLGR